MYQPYASNEYYTDVFSGATIPPADITKALTQASRHIDALTYSRIVGRGFDNLTTFQQDIVQEVCCRMADFEYDNDDMIHSVLQSYAINGVSMSFGESWNLMVQSGVATGSRSVTCHISTCLSGGIRAPS